LSTWDCARNVSNGGDASNVTAGDAGSTKTSKPLRLRCDPSQLPEPPYEQPVVKKLSEMSKQAVVELKDFYYAQKFKRRTQWIKNNKRDRRNGK
jgi:hypothetical protein